MPNVDTRLRVISASRRTDLVAFFPECLSMVIQEEKALVYGPSGRTYQVDLNPKHIHTFVLWSKNFDNLNANRFGLLEALRRYDQLYLHFTITGLGGTFIEKGVPSPEEALTQLEPLVKIAGRPERISVRFDPVVYWKERDSLRTNLHFFEKLAAQLHPLGIKDIRFSFAQWYNKAKLRSKKHGFVYVDPPVEEKIKDARYLADVARRWGMNLYACSQSFLDDVPGVTPSSCINGPCLEHLHPFQAPASSKKDRTQRTDCRCTESVDIGSYTQHCPHSCLYCYANPKV